MSGQLKNDTEERKLRVTLLSVGWKALCDGDLTTINRELAIQMAKHPNVEVSVFLPWCSEEDKKDADGYNVKLIEAVKLPGLKPVLWLASVPDGHAMDCVLGHGVDLGQQIPLIKRNPNYSNCRWIQVVHTVPEEIGMYKSISEGQQMQQTEIELCKMADQVVTIGPKLTDAYKYQIRKPDIFNLTPGILSEFSDIQQASDEERKFHVLVTESGNSEDFYVKGYDIAAKAIAELKDKSYQLKFASKQRGKEDELANKLLQCGIGRNQLMICSFDENRETLANLFSAVNIAILPSKTEGFGLSSLQAISAGLPVLVSGNSGIAEALRKVPTGSQCIVDSEDPAEWARAIKAVRHKERNVRLAEARILRESYSQQFSWEKPCNFLVEKMYSLAFGLLTDHDAYSRASVSALEPAGYQKASTASGASSSEFHSISSTSESPHKQEELKKWKQKMKIVKTEKMKGTSPLTVKPTTGHVKELIEKGQGRKGTSLLTVKPTTGHVKELIEKEQGRKGMFPLPGSSTFEEELKELHMKLQRMEGSSSPTLLSTTDLEEKLGRVCVDLKMLRMEGGFPVLQFSTIDLEKKLDELCMEFQRPRMKGTLPPPELFTADLEDELKGLCSELNRVRMKGSSHPLVSTIEVELGELLKQLQKWRKEVTNRSSSMADVSTPLGDFETIVTAEIRSYVEQNGLKGISEFLKEKLDTWKKTEVHLGVTGDSGNGKSSFVNAIRGLTDDDVGAAIVGVVETTPNLTSFDHPQNPNIKIWDLPEIGTKKFPDMEKYRKKTQFDKYHTFLIFSSSRFTKNDVMLAQEIRKQGKSFFFIRTKIDVDCLAEKRMKSFNEVNMLRKIRIYCLKGLAREGYNPISGEDNIFLISNHFPSRWDFDRLMLAILDALPIYQRESLTLSLNALTSLSREIIKRKVDIFKRRMWLVAVASASVAVVPIPGVSFGVDMALICYEISQYLAQIGIPKEGSETFDILADTTKQQVISLYLNFASTAGISAILAREAGAGIATEEFVRFIPFIGSAIAGTLSFAGTFTVLRIALNKIEAVALAVLEDAAQRSVDDLDRD